MSRRKQSTPSVTVDHSGPIRYAQHRVTGRGRVKFIDVPVFKGLDTRTAKSLWDDKQRHDAGRWTGSRYQPRNNYEGA